MIAEKGDKFENEDLPKILVALHKARAAKEYAVVTVIFAENGGVLEVKVVKTEKIK